MIKKNLQILILIVLTVFTGIASTGAAFAATPTGEDLQKALKDIRSQQLAYIEIEKAAALMEYYGMVLEQADAAQEIDPFLFHQLYRDILKPIDNAGYLAAGDKDLIDYTRYWKAKINQVLRPSGLAGLASLDRQIASAANRFQVDHEEMTLRLVPIRKKPQFRHVNVEMRLKAAKAIADSTVKLVNSDSLNRLFTYNSDSSFLYHHGEPATLSQRSLRSRTAVTNVMLLQVSNQLGKVLHERKMAPVRARAIQLMRKTKQQSDRVNRIPVSQKQTIQTVQTQVAAETEFELRGMLAQVTAYGDKE